MCKKNIRFGPLRPLRSILDNLVILNGPLMFIVFEVDEAKAGTVFEQPQIVAHLLLMSQMISSTQGYHNLDSCSFGDSAHVLANRKRRGRQSKRLCRRRLQMWAKGAGGRGLPRQASFGLPSPLLNLAPLFVGCLGRASPPRSLRASPPR